MTHVVTGMRNMESNRKACRKWWHKNRTRVNASQRRKAETIKAEVLSHYSKGKPACQNPFGQHTQPYMDIRALSIDHVNGGGTRHRKSLKGRSGYHFYRWLKENSFPVGFQVLCMNCQFIKRTIKETR
jgi:hypothetical protein